MKWNRSFRNSQAVDYREIVLLVTLVSEYNMMIVVEDELKVTLLVFSYKMGTMDTEKGVITDGISDPSLNSGPLMPACQTESTG